LTAPQVARHCNADLKTIHNWVNAGKIGAFRTPGRHLRFRIEDVVSFLQEFGYPVPPSLSSTTYPRVVVITQDARTAQAIGRSLNDRAQLKIFDCSVRALIFIGHERPDVVVIDEEHPDVKSETFTSRLESADVALPAKVMVWLSRERTSETRWGRGRVAAMDVKEIPTMWLKISELLAARTGRGAGLATG